MIYTEDFSKWSRALLCMGALVVVPATVAAFTFLGNSAAANRAAGAQMVGIAVGVLSKEGGDKEDQPLREWAVSVLLNPQDPPPLTSAAADDLLKGDVLPARAVPLADEFIIPRDHLLDLLLKEPYRPDAPKGEMLHR